MVQGYSPQQQHTADLRSAQRPRLGTSRVSQIGRAGTRAIGISAPAEVRGWNAGPRHRGPGRESWRESFRVRRALPAQRPHTGA
jgi:hypothetical protein